MAVTNLKRVTLYLEPEQVEWLDRMTKLDNKFDNRSALARWLIAAGINAYRQETSRIIKGPRPWSDVEGTAVASAMAGATPPARR